MKFRKERLWPFISPLESVTWDKIVPKGIVKLTVTAGTYPAQISKEIDFIVVDCLSTYNVILGRLMFNKLEVAMSTYYLKVKFPTTHGIGEIRGDQVLARECDQAVLASGENHKWMIDELGSTSNPEETLQDVEIIPGDPSKVTKIGSTLWALDKTKITTFLKENQDVFAWNHEDMPGIDREIIQHRLNIDPECKLVQQRWRRIFALEHNKVVMEEVDKLLSASFLREVLSWLSSKYCDG